MKKFLLTYFLFCVFFFIFFSSGFVDSQDGFQYLAVARRMYYDKTFEMPIEEYPDENIHMSLIRTDDGKIYSPTGLGYSVSLLPAVLIEDIFLRQGELDPLSAFPLQNDWPVLLFASMTNAVWGALFVCGLYLFLREIDLEHTQSLFLSFLLTISSSVFVYTKHTFAIMMFVACQTWVFLSLKIGTKRLRARSMFFSGFFYGLVVISYNPSFAFLVPALAIYYFSYYPIRISLNWFIQFCRDIGFVVLGVAPFLSLYFWFNNTRFSGFANSGYAGGVKQALIDIPSVSAIFEGCWGVLFSPGKSIFIFTPSIILLIVFWFKLKKQLKAELFAGLSILIIYLWFIGTLQGGVDYPVWHGDSSWGPRYMLPILPLFLVLIGYLYTQISSMQKLCVFTPLIMLGLWINGIGLLLPYQIRFAGLQTDVFANNRNFNVYEYGNEIPRYTPVLKLTKTFIKRVKNVRRTYDHGMFELRLFDGFDYPFDVGWSVWRSVKPEAYFSFKSAENQVSSVNILLKNHQIDPTSSQSAKVDVSLNEQLIYSAHLFPEEERNIYLTLSPEQLFGENVVNLSSSFEASSAAQLKKQQVLFLESISINEMTQNLWTIDYPYVSVISKNIFAEKYHYWGGIDSDPWSIWHMHSGVYEQTFDLWWLRPLHYWDFPKKLFLILFLFDVLGILVLGGIILSHKIPSSK